MEQSKVSIKPGVNILGVFSKLNYKPWHALAEFVDNAVSSHQFWDDPAKPKTLVVEIELDLTGTGRLEVRDNAKGIALEDFDRAFKTAEIPPDRTKLNEFGMGMKTAAIWFARQWTVRTSSFGDPTQRTVSIDIRDILQNQLEELDIVQAPASANAHFTTIRLTELNNLPKGRSIQKIKEHLTGIYREFMRDGSLQLLFNGELLSYEDPEILESPIANSVSSEVYLWRKEIHIQLDETRSASGWVAIRKTGSTTYAGLAILRRGRLIMGSADETYRPEEIFGKTNSFRYQRLFGELHVHGFDVTHTKDSIQWDGLEEDFIEALRGELSSEPLNLIHQAEYMRKDTRPKSEDIETALSNVQQEIELSLPNSTSVLAKESDLMETAVPDLVPSPVEPERQRSITIDTGRNGYWKVDFVVHSNEAVHEWFKLGAQCEQVDEFGLPVTVLNVEVNLAHPFSQKYIGPTGENTELLVAFAANLAISLTLGKKLGAKSAYIVDFLNEVLRPRKILG